MHYLLISISNITICNLILSFFGVCLTTKYLHTKRGEKTSSIFLYYQDYGDRMNKSSTEQQALQNALNLAKLTQKNDEIIKAHKDMISYFLCKR